MWVCVCVFFFWFFLLYIFLLRNASLWLLESTQQHQHKIHKNKIRIMNDKNNIITSLIVSYIQYTYVYVSVFIVHDWISLHYYCYTGIELGLWPRLRHDFSHLAVSLSNAYSFFFFLNVSQYNESFDSLVDFFAVFEWKREESCSISYLIECFSSGCKVLAQKKKTKGGRLGLVA